MAAARFRAGKRVVPLALALVFVVWCGGARIDAVQGRAEVTARGAAALSANSIQWLNGTYGASCLARSGSWSVRVSGNATMDHTALSVVQNNTACALTVTQVVADTTYTASPSIAMTASYQGSASTFAPGAGGVSFYANADLNSASFASNFTVNFSYSDDPKLVSGSLGATYASVSATSTATSSAAPNYTLDLTTGALTATVSDTTSLVTSVSGTANLVQGTIAGGGYTVDQGTLPSNPTFAQLDSGYSNATTTAIAGSPVQIPASAFGLTGVNVSSAVVRTIVIQRNASGVRSYQAFAVTFNCGGTCGVCPSGETSKADSSGMGAVSECCASAATTLNCNGTCVDTLVDDNNCGSCGTVCGSTTALCASGTCAASLSYKATVLADGPVAYWRLDESMGTVAADSAGSNTGTYNSCTLGAASGLLNDADKSTTFNGSSSTVTAASTNVNFTGTSSFSVEAWVYPTASGSTVHLVNHETPSGNREGYAAFINSSNDISFERYISNAGNNVTAGSAISTSTWYHVVGTYNGSNLYLYVNGTQYGPTADARSANGLADSLYLGACENTKYFQGRIDEVAIYNKALTSAQVTAHYHASGR